MWQPRGYQWDSAANSDVDPTRVPRGLFQYMGYYYSFVAYVQCYYKEQVYAYYLWS